MDHKYYNCVIRVLFLVMWTFTCTINYAMENSSSLPEQSTSQLKVEKLKKFRRNSVLSQDNKLEKMIALVLSNQHHDLDVLLNQESYEKIMQEKELSYWISLACSKQAHQTASLLLARFERNYLSPTWKEIHEHAFSQADQHKMLIEFCCSLYKYRLRYSLETD